MNNTSANCYRPSMEFPFLNRRQLDVLTMINSVVMVVNLTSNMLVIYVLIKTEQLANNACKLIFMLSVSDFMIGLLAQTYRQQFCMKKFAHLWIHMHLLLHFLCTYQCIPLQQWVLIVTFGSNIMQILKPYGQQELCQQFYL